MRHTQQPEDQDLWRLSDTSHPEPFAVAQFAQSRRLFLESVGVGDIAAAHFRLCSRMFRRHWFRREFMAMKN
jgi:hypothetical protein